MHTGGLGLNNTQYTRIAEATVLDGGFSVTLGAHQTIGLKVRKDRLVSFNYCSSLILFKFD